MSPELRAADIMQTRIRSVTSKMSVADFERFLMQHEIGGAPVIDEDKLVGVASRSDIVRVLAGDFAAGSIETEYYWDFAGATTLREHSDGARADASSVESALSGLTVADLMVEDIISVTPDAPVSHVAQLMDRRHIHRVLVVENDRLHGVLTTMDLTRLLADGRATATS